MISVVIPAHNEEARIGECLTVLLEDAEDGSLDVVVVANGCTDGTAEVAGAFGAPVRVVEISTASKTEALNTGERLATGFPRFYIDADVLVSWADVTRVAEALDDLPTSLAAPARRWVVDDRPWVVRSFFRVLEQLPQVRASLTGGGVLAVSQAGRGRFEVFPPVLADDRFLEAHFAASERRVVLEAISTVQTPRTVRDLVRRRARLGFGNRELLDRDLGCEPRRWHALWSAVKTQPRLVPDLPAFLGVSAAARVQEWRLRRRDPSDRWQRDASTR